MTAPSDPSRIVTRGLAAEVEKKVRERGLVVWLDAEAQYGGLVDALAGGDLGFAYPVVRLRGSYLEVMLALQEYGNGLQPEKLLVHLPGLNKDSVKETPVFELFAAGTLFEKNLGTVVRESAVGVATPDQLEGFLRGSEVTLAGADAWLAERSAQPKDGISLLLHGLGLEDVVLALLARDRRFEPYLPKDGDKLLAFLETGLGLDAAWRAFRLGGAALAIDGAATLVASWLMALEFVHDLKEPPVTPELRPLADLGPFAKTSRKLAARFREQLPDVYEELASDLQAVLEQERTSHHADALGAIDTFRFEESATRAAALGAMRGDRRDWAAARAFASDRTPEKSFWVKRSPSLQRTWELVRLAADAGGAFETTATELSGCRSLEEATQRYAERLAPVDRQHRLFEQRAHAIIAPDLDDHDALLEVRATVRAAYRAWADGINRAFFALCVKLGALPERSLRQRGVYDDVVQPLVEEGTKTAFFMVDALRFEMAQGLADELRREKYKVKLSPRLAELPTETAVGMNALAPVDDNGRLHAVLGKGGALSGFRSRTGFVVNDPATRVRAITARSLLTSPADLGLEAFQDMSLTQLKRTLSGKPSLVVVRSRELDTAGEHNLHLGTFEHTLALLKSAVSLLAQAGVERFVISSDHGFLLQDKTAGNVDFGASKKVPDRRYALLDQPSGMAGVLEVRLSSLDYDADQDSYLVFAPDTALWKVRDDVAPFVHGGNSLQERVIPVLEIERTVVRGRTSSKYEVVASPEQAHLGRQRLRIAVRLQSRETATLGFLTPKTVTLALRVVGRDDVAITLLNAEPPATLSSGRILVQPNRNEALVEFELSSELDEKVRIEVFHPDAQEDVTAKVVEGFFDTARHRRPVKPSTPPPAVTAAVEGPPAPVAPSPSWEELIADEGYRQVLKIIDERRNINEEELFIVLKSAPRVRAFARSFDALVQLLPFGIEVRTATGMKVYAKKD